MNTEIMPVGGVLWSLCKGNDLLISNHLDILVLKLDKEENSKGCKPWSPSVQSCAARSD